ncbi:MAG: polysaccharide deacetylase family protein [Oscillospiraceae bacterium]|jgi:peptidoglycan/xylan/chitin deacetylase (PgdA/CDA1 family)|nr:polysaccharide deacetylase family protein [Oscillospiraceae bacterium]
MFVVTLSRKRALRAALVILAVFIGVAVGIAAVLTSINTQAAETRLPIYSVERPDNKISLTFDCAWGNSNTDELLEILAEHGVFATFFVTGEFVDKFPDDIRRIFAAGHEIANHSDSHPHIKGMNINSLIDDTREAERKITMVTGVRPTLYRSPYGEYDANSIKTIEGLGYKFIQWSVDSIDWQEPDPATIVRRITDKTVPGSILLFHNDLENTTQALPEVLTRLRQAGFEFVRAGELIYYEDYFIDHAGKQIRDVRTILPPDISADNALVEAIEIVRARLTLDEIMSLQDGISPSIVAKLTPHLSSGQLRALSELTATDAEAIMAAITATNDHEYEIPENNEEFDYYEHFQNFDHENKDGGQEEITPINEQAENDNIPDLHGLLEENGLELNELLEEGVPDLNGLLENMPPGADLNELLAEDEKS